MLSNLIASSYKFISKFIELKLFGAIAEYLNSAPTNFELNELLVINIGNALYSGREWQVQEIGQQGILEQMTIKLATLALGEGEECNKLLHILLNAIWHYLLGTNGKQAQELVERQDLLCDIMSGPWTKSIKGLAY